MSTGSFLQTTTMEYGRYAQRDDSGLKIDRKRKRASRKSVGKPVGLELRACSNVEVVPGYT